MYMSNYMGIFEEHQMIHEISSLLKFPSVHAVTM